MKDKSPKFSELPFIVPSEKRTLAKLEALVNELETTGSAKTALQVIKRWDKYTEELSTATSLIYVLYSCNTTNKTYVNAQRKMDELTPYISKYYDQFNKLLAKHRARKDLEKILGKYYFQKIDASLKAFDEKIIPEMIEENKLVSEYESIKGGASVEFEGQTYNLSQMGKFLEDKDPVIRKKAAKITDDWYAANEEKMGEIYDKLVSLRHSMAEKLGYKNYVELGYLRLGRTDYNAKKVKGYRAQIAEEVVPLCNKLYKAQMKILGIKHPQYYDYNLAFPTGNPTPIGDTKFILETAQKMYNKMSKETAEYFNFMVEKELLDLEARPGKAPGGYQTSFPKYKEPFIFSNFNGTAGDVDVLTHEGGHAFQAYTAFKNIKIPDYRNATLESCEIHSMSMEFFAWPYAKDFFGVQEEKYRYLHLSNAIEFLPYGITVDEFQHWVYEHPTASHTERCNKWKEIESRYTPHKKYDDTPCLNKGTWWLKQGHIFSSPFYYIDYTLAQVVAFQFLVESHKNYEKAWKKYYKLVKCGGKYPFCELLEKNHLRNPFEEGSIKKVMNQLKKILKEFDISKF